MLDYFSGKLKLPHFGVKTCSLKRRLKWGLHCRKLNAYLGMHFYKTTSEHITRTDKE